MRVLLLLPVMLVLSSCGTVTGGAGRDGSDLDGRTFLSTATSEAGAPRALVDGSRVRLTFEDGQLSAQAGCNTMSGGYRLDGDRLVVDALATTEMGCPQDLMEQDAWLADLLGSGPRASVDGDQLTLRSGDTEITLLDRVVADPDLPLVGTVWRVESLVTGDAVSSTPAGTEATLDFGDDGSVKVNGGCNRGRASYTTDGGAVELGPLMLTRRACPGAAGELERAVRGVLDAGELTVDITADRLSLTAADGTGLVLRAG